MDEVVDYLYGRSTRFLATGLSDAFQQEIDNGKMFGVLVVAPADATGSSQLSYLAAYSGQIGGRSDWPGFVPAVFDYLQALLFPKSLKLTSNFTATPLSALSLRTAQNNIFPLF